ncbi:hypothetical protein D9756_004229 [Leucocoprinus leucothites]|uniref:BTB domain-containing protein n=1 Tax=Leucocoprinus leucothites TaxID=201217 RepID=A0A8H5DAG5_9AGAR|nr:hypothetical protein D9756_004229 [Leucoagaricus leucothites]
MTWNSFSCNNPDFTVRSIPDDVVYRVRRTALINSEVFRDMFECCSTEATQPPIDETLDLDESSQALSALLHLLHYPPKPPVAADAATCVPGDEVAANSKFNREKLLPRVPSYDHCTVIPLPVLQPMLFSLVDKYGLSVDIFKVLCSHLLAHAPLHPLRVYGFAASFEPNSLRRRSRVPLPISNHDTLTPPEDQFGAGAEKEMEKQMRKVASKASQFLEPIGSYSMAEVLDTIPSVKALHCVVQLQHLRVKTLREVLNGSEIFPKDNYLSRPSFVRDGWYCVTPSFPLPLQI